MLRPLALLLLAALPVAAHTITGTVIGPDGPLSGIRVRFHYGSDPAAIGYATTSDFQGRLSGPAPEEILFLEAIPREGTVGGADEEPPPGLTGPELSTTTTMPGFILEESSRPAMTYTYDAQRLAREFPNLDLHDADGFAGTDTISISFLLSGTDSAGVRRHFARRVVIQVEEMQMPDQHPRSRRRAVRK